MDQPDGVAVWPDLSRIATAGTASGKVEVATASGLSGYAAGGPPIQSDFDTADGGNGRWQLDAPVAGGAPTLWFVKTAGAGLGAVEVLWDAYDAATGRYARAGQATTNFSPGDGPNGTWQMYSPDGAAQPDLYFLKTLSTSHDLVEVHVNSAASGYSQRVLAVESDFGTFDHGNGVWQVGAPNVNGWPTLWFVKTTSTGTGLAEVHWAVYDPATNTYRRAGDLPTRFPQQTAATGVWQIAIPPAGIAPVLYAVQSAGTLSGRVEVATAAATEPLAATTTAVPSGFAADAAPTWQLTRPAVVPPAPPPTLAGNSPAPAAPARSELTIAQSPGALWSIGGVVGRAAYLADVLRLVVNDDGSIGDSAWEQMAPLPKPRSATAVTHDGGTLYVAGGIALNAQVGSFYTPETSAYDIATNTWSELPPMPAGQAAAHAFVDLTGNLHVIGGMTYQAPAHMVLDAARKTWTTRDLPPFVRLGSITIMRRVGDVVWVFGNTFCAYDLATGAWSQRAPFPGTFDAAPGPAFTVGRAVLLVVHPEHAPAQSWLYDTVADTWQQGDLAVSATPAANVASFAAVSGTNAYVVEPSGDAQLLRFVAAPPATVHRRLAAQALAWFPFDGTLTDAITPSLPPGQGGGYTFVKRWDGRDAVQLSGTVAGVKLPPFGPDGSPTWPGFTVSASLRLDGKPTEPLALFGDPRSVVIELRPTGITATRWDGATQQWPDVRVVAGRWYHLALAVDVRSGAMTLFLDGVAVAGPAPVPVKSPLSHPFDVAGAFGTDAPFALANLGVFTAPLTADEVLCLACDGFHPEGTFSSTAEYLSYATGGGSVICADAPVLDPSKRDGLSVGAWVSTTEIDLVSGSAATILGRAGSYDIGIDEQGRACAHVTAAGGTVVTVTADAPLGAVEWSYIGLSLDAQHVGLFVDGQLFQVAAPSGGYAAVPSAALAIGSAWPAPIYSVGIYGGGFAPADFRVRMAEAIDPHDDTQLLVFYDFAANPPAAVSPVAALAEALQLPPSGRFAQFARGVVLGLRARVDCGKAADTTLTADSPTLTVSGWVRQYDGRGYQTVAGRMSVAGGYVLAVRDGHLEATIVDPNGVVTGARSATPLPPEQFSQVGAVFSATGGDRPAYAIALVLNGRLVDSARTAVPAVAPAVGDAATAFAVGAQLGRGGRAAPDAAAAAFRGLVQRLTAFAGAVDPYDLYYAPSTAPLVADWGFDGEAPADATGGHPAWLENGAWLQTLRSGERLPVPPLSPAQRRRRLADELPLSAAPEVPAEHADILASDPSLDGRLICHERDGVTFLVAHDIGEDGVARARCVFAASNVDPAVMAWVALGVAVVAAFGAALYRVRIDMTAATDVVLKAWNVSTKFRAATYDVGAALSATSIPGLVFAFLRALWDAGLLVSLLRCFRLSYFSVLRIAGSFAPYIGAALMLESLAEAAVKIYLEVKKNAPKQDAKPPNVSARPSAPALTVNGDPISIAVVLDGPPPANATVTARAPDPLKIVDQRPLVFTPANFGVPQRVAVRAVGDDETWPDVQPVAVSFASSGAVAATACPLDVLVARLACDPAPVTLELDEEGDSYQGEFTVSATAPITSDAPLTVTFAIDDVPVGQTDFEFDPPSVVLDNQPGQLGARSKRVKAKLARQKRAKTDVKLTLTAAASRPGTAGNGRRYVTRLSIRAAEETTLTMVDAHAGNCFVLTNTSSRTNPPKTRCAVIDGGVSGTYARMSGYLPKQDVPIDVYCSHYDDDHIAGLLELWPARSAQIEKLIFNPPPPRTAKALRALADAGHHVDPHVLQSVDQGNQLARLAGTKLRQVRGTPPLAATQPGITLPALAVRWAGPSPPVWQLLVDDLARGRDPRAVPVNRASLLFTLDRTGAIFLLQTGDGYDIGTRRDVQAAVHASGLIDFLQVPHHGSRNNSDALFYAALPARNYLISTDWVKHGHPHPEMIAALVAGRPFTADPFNIYINADASVFPNSYVFPPGNYAVYLRASGRPGITFTAVAGKIKVTDGDVVKRR